MAPTTTPDVTSTMLRCLFHFTAAMDCAAGPGVPSSSSSSMVPILQTIIGKYMARGGLITRSERPAWPRPIAFFPIVALLHTDVGNAGLQVLGVRVAALPGEVCWQTPRGAYRGQSCRSILRSIWACHDDITTWCGCCCPAALDDATAIFVLKFDSPMAIAIAKLFRT